MSNRPNVLWVMSDQHNANCAGFAGHPNVKTPHLDQLARDGVVFTRAYCNNPICGPSRASFLSGTYPHTHGVTGNSIWELETPPPANVAATFRRNGYQTALIGKAHLPKSWLQAGFEDLRLCDLCDSDAKNPFSCDYFAYLEKHGLASQYDLAALPQNHPGAKLRAFTSEIPYRHSVEAWTGDQTLEFLESRDQTRPFFAQISFQRPHDPHAPSPEKSALYDPKSLKLPASAVDLFERDFAGKPAWMRERLQEFERYPYRPHDEADLKRQLAAYFALITCIDAEIGRVFDWLKQNGEWDNTIIVYHADHGDFAGEHGLCLKNLGIYESIHRIPFVWKWPGCEVGTRRDDLVESVDLAQTLCALAEIEGDAGFEGRDLSDSQLQPLGATVCEWDFMPPHQTTVFAARDARFRLVFYKAQPDEGELYDTDDDPGELKNLWNNPEFVSEKARLLGIALAHVGDFRRVYSFADDLGADPPPPGDYARRLHKGLVTWPEIAPQLTK